MAEFRIFESRMFRGNWMWLFYHDGQIVTGLGNNGLESPEACRENINEICQLLGLGKSKFKIVVEKD